MYELETLLLKQKEKEKYTLLGSNHKSVRNFMNSEYFSFQFTVERSQNTEWSQKGRRRGAEGAQDGHRIATG